MTPNQSADLHGIAKELAKDMRCNCDLDSNEPEASTGHSYFCRIHRAALTRAGQ